MVGKLLELPFLLLLSIGNPKKDNFHKTILRLTNSTFSDTQLN